MLQYYAQNFFAPVVIFGHVDATNTLNVNIVSDLLTTIEEANGILQIYKWDSFEPIDTINVSLNMVKINLKIYFT